MKYRRIRGSSQRGGNHLRKVLSGAVVLGLVSSLMVLTAPEPAEAVTISVPTADRPRAQMANHTPWSSANGSAQPNADNTIRYGSTTQTAVSGTISNPSGGAGNASSNGTANGYSNGNTAFVGSGSTAFSAHGRRSGATSYGPGTLDLSNQSAIGFAPNDVASFDTGVPFNLGKMIHSNNPVSTSSSPNDWFRGDMNIKFMAMDMTFRWRLNETANSGTTTDPSNNDLLDFLNQTSPQTFTGPNGLTYTLALQGFTNNGTSSACPATLPANTQPANQFSTVETQVTYGCLWASVEQVRPVTVKKVVESPYGTAPANNFAMTSTSSLAGTPWAAGSWTLAAGASYGPRNYNSGEQITISEGTQAAPWAFTSVRCVDGLGANVGTISGQTVTIAKGTTTATAAAAPITCTYTNTYTPRATLTLNKNVVSTGQPAPVAVPANWTLTAQGEGSVAAQSVSGNGNTAAVTSQSVIAGTYKLGESANNPTATAGYVQDGNWTCTNGVTVSADSKITLTNGQSTTCSVTNRYQTGSLAITKTVTSTPGGGYTQGASKSFTAQYSCAVGSGTPIVGTRTVNPNNTNGQAGATVTIPNLPAGAICTVTELNAPTGTSVDLVNASWVWGSPTVNPGQAVTVTAGGTVTANLTNPVTQNTGSLVITKQVTPRSGVPAAAYLGTSSRVFPISYSCTIGTTTTASGTVSVANGASQTVGGIPATSTCVLSETLTAQSGDFLDASYRWDGRTVSQPAAIPVNGTTTGTVTNFFTRDLVDLTLQKVVTGAGYTTGTFQIDWSCGSGASVNGTVTLAGGASQTVQVPAGVACTVSEQAGRPDLAPGYVWADATYAGLTGGSVSVPRGETRTVTVTNPNVVGYNRISVTKQIANFSDQVAPGTAFEITVSCDAAAQGQSEAYAQVFTFTTALGGAQETPYLPVGTTCSVVETSLPNGSSGLVNSSYVWSATPVYEGLTDGVVTVPVSTTPAPVVVTNDITRAYGPLSIVKSVSVPEGVVVSDPFTGAWSCTFGGSEIAAGTWAAPGSGGAATLASTSGDHLNLLVGSLCTVTETSPTNPVPGDNSYTWAVVTPSNLNPMTTSGIEATVSNVLNRSTGTFSVSKSVAGGSAPAQFANTNFTFDYVCEPASGADITGVLTMVAGGSASPTEAIPAGSICTVTERLNERPTPVDPYRWDGVSFGVTGADGSPVGENGVTFTIPAEAGAQVAVVATNAISAKTGAINVTKQVTQLEGGFTGGSRDLFPMTLSCVDPTTGASAQVGAPQIISNGATATWSGIPLGAACSVAEGAIGDAEGNGLLDASFAWNAPTIDPVSASVVEDGTPTLTVTNSLHRVYGALSLTKVFDNGGYTGVVDPARTYAGTWTCTYGGSMVAEGTWSGVGSSVGTPATMVATTGDLNMIPLTAACTATEEPLSDPDADDESYEWQDPQILSVASLSVTASENVVVVTNELTRKTGSITVQKALSGEVEGFAGGEDFAGFPVSYVCALDPDDFANAGAIDRLTGTVDVQAGAAPVTLAGGIPQGWSCAVSEGSFVTAEHSWLLDDSYVWGDPSITVDGEPASSHFEIGADPTAVAVTNPVSRQNGTIAITKQIAAGFDAIVNEDATFSGEFVCVYAEGSPREVTYTGTWSVNRSGAATLEGDTELPYGSACSVTENTPTASDLVDASWAWSAASVVANAATVSGDGPATFTVTNTPTRVYSSLEITKALTGPADGFSDAALSVSGSWVCTYPGETPVAGTWTAPAVGGPATLSPANAQIPVTASCAVREDTLDPGVFIDQSYGWGDAPERQEVVVPADAAAQVTMTNTVVRFQGSFTITKNVVRSFGVTPQVPGNGITYSGTYECVYNGVSTGILNWSTPSSGAPFADPVQYYTGTICTVHTEADPSRSPVVGDDSFVWATRTLGDPVTVGVNTAANVNVTNLIVRNTGSFSVTKVFEGDSAGLPNDPRYTFTWECVADNGDRYPTDPADENFSLAAGDFWAPSESIPVSSQCSVAETGMPEPRHDSFTWSTAMSISEGIETSDPTSGSGEGDPTIEFETPDSSSTQVIVTATNTLTRGLGSFSVTKDVPEGSVVSADMTFGGEFLCTGPLDGDSVSGTWGPILPGDIWTSDPTIPLDASCAVTSEERSVWPFAADRSYQWDGDADLGAAVVSAAEPETITVTNTTTRRLGSVIWQKTAAESGELLAGSTWTLTGPGVPADTVVIDCTESACPAGEYLDQNPEAGEFSLTELGWGEYTLVEHAAPAGYYPDRNSHPFTIGSDDPGPLDVVDVGPIENIPIEPPTIPLTGGLGRDFFTILGFGILAIGIAAAGAMRIRNRRSGQG